MEKLAQSLFSHMSYCWIVLVRELQKNNCCVCLACLVFNIWTIVCGWVQKCNVSLGSIVVLFVSRRMERRRSEECRGEDGMRMNC